MIVHPRHNFRPISKGNTTFRNDTFFCEGWKYFQFIITYIMEQYFYEVESSSSSILVLGLSELSSITINGSLPLILTARYEGHSVDATKYFAEEKLGALPLWVAANKDVAKCDVLTIDIIFPHTFNCAANDIGVVIRSHFSTDLFAGWLEKASPIFDEYLPWFRFIATGM